MGREMNFWEWQGALGELSVIIMHLNLTEARQFLTPARAVKSVLEIDRNPGLAGDSLEKLAANMRAANWRPETTSRAEHLARLLKTFDNVADAPLPKR